MIVLPQKSLVKLKGNKTTVLNTQA